MEDHEIINQRLAAEFGCDHPHAVPHYRDTGRVRGVWRQCLDCGEKLERLSLRDFMPYQLRQMPRFDEERDRQLWQAKSARRHELWEEVKEQRDARWWAFYEAYLNSPEWADKRRRVLERERTVQQRPEPLRQGCWKRPGVQAHHLSYHNLGAEPLWELTLVCLVCHGHLHPHRQEESA
jgi:hypothetical protein